MTARTIRRISQPDSYHSAPNRSATTRATHSIATSHSDTTACAAPPAQALPRDSVRASIRKAGRCLTAPLARRHPHKSSTKDGAGTPPLPLAQLHPRKALPRVSFAARIRKAGRNLTAPLARRHPRKSSTKDGAGTPPLPLAQLHPRKALSRVSFAARIRKAGRCLTAPLARRRPRKFSARPAERKPTKGQLKWLGKLRS